MIEELTIKQGNILDNKAVYTQVVDDLIYLLSCSVNEVDPDIERINQIDLNAVYELATFHSLAAAVSFAIERVIELPYQYDQAKKKAIRKLALFDIERNKILSCFNKGKIWYLPLKGIILKDYYPKYGMREMSDNDILCDSSRMQDIKTIMEHLGFIKEECDVINHDVYSKQFISFEIHDSLFIEKECKDFFIYYKNIKSRLICSDDSFEYQFRTEDLYIYLLAHTYKHYNNGGTGIRSLLDTYVFLNRHNDNMDWNYVSHELATLSLRDFEKMNRKLALKAFSGTPLDDEEKQLFMYFVSSGAYGIEEHSWKNHLSKNLSGDDSDSSKRKYLIDRVFIHGEDLKNNYPFVYRHKILLPGLYIYRFIKVIFIKPKKIMREYKRLKQFKYSNR